MVIKENQWARLMSNGPETAQRLKSFVPELESLCDMYSPLKSLYHIDSPACESLHEMLPRVLAGADDFDVSFGDNLSRYKDYTAAQHMTRIRSVKSVLWTLMDETLVAYDELSREGAHLLSQRSQYTQVIRIVDGSEVKDVPPHESVYDAAIRALEVRDIVKDLLRRIGILERRIVDPL